MKINEPIGDAGYGSLAVRITLGCYLLFAGFAKFDDINGFVEQIQTFGFLNEHLATVYAILLPYLEITAGFLLLVGLWTTLGALLTCALLFSFIYMRGLFPYASHLINKDLILFACALSLMFTGAGAMSIDKFRKNG